MTPEQRALDLVRSDLWTSPPVAPSTLVVKHASLIADAIRAAVEAEREACANIVQYYAELPPDPKARARIIDAIAAIRRRGKEAKP